MFKLNLARHRRIAFGLGAVAVGLTVVSSTAVSAATWHHSDPSFTLHRRIGTWPPHSIHPTFTATSSSTPAAPGTSAAPSPTKTVPTATPTSAAPTTSTPVTSAPATSAPATPPPSCANPKNPWNSLAACGWAGPGNTGYVAADCPAGLAVNSGSTTRVITISKDNTVISCQRITGSLDIQARNVVIKDSYVSYDGGGQNGTGVIKIEDGASATVSHVEINGLNHTHSCVWLQGTSAVVNNINCYGINDGIFSWADTGYSATTGDNFSITDSYFHNFTHNAANGHSDGYQTEGASNGVIKHNTYDMNSGDDSAIAIWDSLKNASNIAVSGNLITGGGFSIYAEDYSPSEASPAGGFSVTNVTFTGNTFSTRAAGCVGDYGVWFTRPTWKYQGGPTDGWHRSGNRVLETGEAIDSGNPHSGGQLCS
jgi:hypothetical protein